jgi:peptidoglycan/LPS O-acetylase OafA/YrhL
MVVVYHYTVGFETGKDSYIPYGVLAVNLFFIISGFVIFMTLSKTKTAADFIVSRFSRLYPVFWAAVLITQTVVRLNPLPEHTYSWFVAFVNLSMIAGPLNYPWVDSVYWSLVVELMFYCIMVLFFVAGLLQHITKIVIPWLLLQMGVFLISSHFNHPIPQLISIFFLLKYAHLFLAGILFYKIRTEGVTLSLQFLLLCCLITQFVIKGLIGGVFGVVFFALFYLLSINRLKWIAFRPLLFLGTISYSLYLVHQNIGFVIMRALSSCSRITQILAAFFVVMILSTLLTFLIEQPSLKAIRKLYKKHQS